MPTNQTEWADGVRGVDHELTKAIEAAHDWREADLPDVRAANRGATVVPQTSVRRRAMAGLAAAGSTPLRKL
jgi:hypothetical protein